MVNVVRFGEFAPEGEFEFGGGVRWKMKEQLVLARDIDRAVRSIPEDCVKVDVGPGDPAGVLNLTENCHSSSVFRFAECDRSIPDQDLT